MNWYDARGKPQIKRLQMAVKEAGGFEGDNPRWQTAKEWVRGETIPSVEYSPFLGQVLGMTLEELAGVALAHDPDSQAWRDFLETPEGQSMTSRERLALSQILWPKGLPTSVGPYRVMLSALRSD